MKKELRKNTPNRELIKQRMDITFAQRRQLINSTPLIAEIQDCYPALFSPSEIGCEFKRLTDTELHQTFASSLSKAASKILTEVKNKPRPTPTVMKLLQIEDRDVSALLVLPALFGNDSFFKFYEVCSFSCPKQGCQFGHFKGQQHRILHILEPFCWPSLREPAKIPRIFRIKVNVWPSFTRVGWYFR